MVPKRIPTLPLYAAQKNKKKPFFFFFSTAVKQTPLRLIQQHEEQDQEEEEEEEILEISNRGYWSRKVHDLCTVNRNPDAALQLLDRLRLRGYQLDSLNLSSIIHSLCSLDRSDEAHRRLIFSASTGWIPDDRTANVLIARLIDCRTPVLTLQVLNALFIAKPEFLPSVINYNRLIYQLCSQSKIQEAKYVLSDMRRRGRQPNLISYTTLINGLSEKGEIADVRKVFDEMRENDVLPNSLTYSMLVKCVLRKRRVDEAKELVDELWLRMGEEKDLLINSAAFANLVDALCREGYFHEVFRIAEEMPQGKYVDERFAYAHMIDSLCKAGMHHGASRIVYIMRKRGFTPSLIAYNSIVHGLSKDRGCMRAYQLLKEGIIFGYSMTESTYRVLVEALCHELDIEKAKDVTELMLEKEGVDRKRIYNIFLSSLRLVDNPSEQLNVLVQMLQKQCLPDIVTLNTVIHGFCKLGRVSEAKKILDDMSKGKFCAPDVVTFTTIIQGLLDVGKTGEALDLLHYNIPDCSSAPNTITYNVVIRGLCKLQNIDKAKEIFEEMAAKGVHADSSTHSVIINGLCQMGRLEEVKKLWDEVVWPSKSHDDYVYAAILRGLCCSGRLNEACDFLYELVDCGVAPGIVNYNILISCACKQRLKREAYQIVGEMRKNGLEPDAVTWRILDRFHEKEIQDRITSNQGLSNEDITINRERMEEFDDADFRILPEEKRTDEFEHVDPLEGLVDPIFDDKFTKDEVDDCQGSENAKLARNISNVESLKPQRREPLSKIARKVFGLA